LPPKPTERIFVAKNDQMHTELKDNNMVETHEKTLKTFALLATVEEDPVITVRDDLYDFPMLLDAVKLWRRKRTKSRFRLVDSGTLSVIQLEWLAAEGADIYTNDELGRSAQDLENIQMGNTKGHSILAYFHSGALEDRKDSSPDLSGLKNMGANGVYIHLSNKDIERDLSELIPLADLCQRGQSRLVYYHHKDLDPALFELSRAGTWIHISDKSPKSQNDMPLLTDIIRSAHASGTNLVLHVGEGMEFQLLKELQKAGAVILFKSTLIDYRSSLRALAERSRKQRLDPRAYYLFPILL
jgi:hypothetical protein